MKPNDDKFRRSLKPGDFLFHQGDAGDCAYVIESGLLEVYRGKGGSRKVLALLGPGEFIGEMAIIDQGPRTATAIARKPTRLRVITGAHLQGKVDSADPLVRVLLRVILKRYRAGMAGLRNKSDRPGSDRKAALTRIKLQHDLERALEQDQFVLQYQPIVRLEDLRIAGFEALVRWQHPTRGMVPPVEFIPAMEESGLIHRLTRWVLVNACAAIRRLNGGRRTPLFVGVNLSGRDIEDPQIVENLTAALRASGVPPALLHVEMTESVLVNSLDFAQQVISRCRKLGVKVGVDDFGTGYSSLNYLRHFAVDTLKIDRSFVKPVSTEEDNRKILRTMRDLAHAMNMSIVAEGVEDLSQARMLRELGLEFAQGYLFSRPATEPQAAHLLAADWPWSFDRRLGSDRRVRTRS